MWPAKLQQPGSGTKVAVLDREGGTVLLQGFSDEAGFFVGRLSASWIGKQVYIVVREVSFKYDYFNPLKVERWGLFLAVRQEKDLFYNGTQGAKLLDPRRWESWNATAEHIRASAVINSAARRAKIAWPIRQVGLLVAVAVGVAGFVVHPIIGLVLGVITYGGTEVLAHVLLQRGY
ncbi:MAG TPA: hypothetical protein VMN81_05380 [Vicinamibacterales bacterium]|nr:hypothetical protein [Vicinamibacterales bacterium]